jgi:hypothetical protein
VSWNVVLVVLLCTTLHASWYALVKPGQTSSLTLC